MKDNKLYTLVTSDTVSVFWSKPEYTSEGVSYKVYLDGKECGETNKTHYSFKKLKPNSKYRVKVEYIENSKIGKAVKIDKVSFVTGKEKKVIDITKEPYNAVGDGKTMNTKAFQMAIDEAGAKDRIYIPKGVFLTGSLHLHSNIEIYLEKDAVIKGTDNPRDYLPKIPSRFEGLEILCYSSLINMGTMDHSAEINCENVLIHGKGTIESGGKSLAEKIIKEEKKLLSNEKIDYSEFEKEETLPGRVRPRLINISNSKNIRISGLNLNDGASWNVHMIYSENVVTDHCKFNSENVWNGDGWNPDSSRDCTIFACEFNTGDDAIAIKSGKNPEGNKINIPAKNINIFDCISKYGHGIAIGSEMSGGVENINIWDCDMAYSEKGFEIKSTPKRGGYVRNVKIRDSVFPRVLVHSVDYNNDGKSAESIPEIYNFSAVNVTLTGKYQGADKKINQCNAIEIRGFENTEAVRDIEFKRILICNDASVSLQNCSNVILDKITVKNEI